MDFIEAIRWMTDNEKLAGWAQAIGAVFALLIAIYIPWAERRRAHRADALLRAESQRRNVGSLHFLFCDIENWLKRVISHADHPVDMSHVEALPADLLDRARTLANRDLTLEQQSSLFLGHGAVTITLSFISTARMTSGLLTPEAVALIADGLGRTEEERRRSEYWIEQTSYQAVVASGSTLLRPITWMLMRTHWGRSYVNRRTDLLVAREEKRIKRGW